MTQIAVKRHCRPAGRFGFGVLLHAVSLMNQRRKLARLDDRALEDIGITRAEAEAEASRSVWDAPEFWHK